MALLSFLHFPMDPLNRRRPPRAYAIPLACPNSLKVRPVLVRPSSLPSPSRLRLSVSLLLSIISTFGALHSLSRKLTDGAVIVFVFLLSPTATAVSRDGGWTARAGNIPYVENSISRTIACTTDGCRTRQDREGQRELYLPKLWEGWRERERKRSMAAGKAEIGREKEVRMIGRSVAYGLWFWSRNVMDGGDGEWINAS